MAMRSEGGKSKSCKLDSYPGPQPQDTAKLLRPYRSQQGKGHPDFEGNMLV